MLTTCFGGVWGPLSSCQNTSQVGEPISLQISPCQRRPLAVDGIASASMRPCTANDEVQGSTAPSNPQGAEPFTLPVTRRQGPAPCICMMCPVHIHYPVQQQGQASLNSRILKGVWPTIFEGPAKSCSVVMCIILIQKTDKSGCHVLLFLIKTMHDNVCSLFG